MTPPGELKVLETSGPEDPERCASAGTEGWDGTKDEMWDLTPGSNICMRRFSGHRSAMLTVVLPPNATDPILTFHYILWQRRR